MKCAANLHLAYCDLFSPNHPDALRLEDLFTKYIDLSKHGNIPSIKLY